MNPLKSLIEINLKEQGISRSQLAKKLGYKNINKGLRRLDAFIDNPVQDELLVSQLSSALAVKKDVVSDNIRERKEHITAEEGTKFIPYLQVRLDRPPSPIFVAAMLPHLTRISVPTELYELPYHEEISQICTLYQQHREKYKPAWPAGDGFRYFRAYDQCLAFDSNCQMVEDVSCNPFLAQVRL